MVGSVVCECFGVSAANAVGGAIAPCCVVGRLVSCGGCVCGCAPIAVCGGVSGLYGCAPHCGGAVVGLVVVGSDASVSLSALFVVVGGWLLNLLNWVVAGVVGLA